MKNGRKRDSRLKDNDSNCSAAARIAGQNHWVFDLDGILTVAVHDFAAIRRELSIPDGSDILGHLASLPEHHARPLHNRLQEIELELSAVTQAAHGALELVDHLHTIGASLGVLTRNTRENALRTLELIGLGDYFEADNVLGRDESPPKPDPDGIHHLAVRWNADPAAMVMVGDYLYDLQAGRAAGALTVHVDTTRGFRWPELADVGVGTLDELLACIRMGALEIDAMKPHLHVACAIIEHNGKVLAAQRSESMSLPLKWEFPGGKLEPGETAQRCLARELREELALEIAIGSALSAVTHSYENFQVTLHPFVCSLVNGVMTLHEHRAVAWMEPVRMLELDWAEADLPVIAEYLAQQAFGSQGAPDL